MFDKSNLIELDNAREALAIGFTHAMTVPGLCYPLYFRSLKEAESFMSVTIPNRCIESLEEVLEA